MRRDTSPFTVWSTLGASATRTPPTANLIGRQPLPGLERAPRPALRRGRAEVAHKLRGDLCAARWTVRCCRRGDNGASAEGMLNGTPNAFTTFNGVSVPVKDQLLWYPFWGVGPDLPAFCGTLVVGDGHAAQVDEAGGVALRRDGPGDGFGLGSLRAVRSIQACGASCSLAKVPRRTLSLQVVRARTPERGERQCQRGCRGVLLLGSQPASAGDCHSRRPSLDRSWGCIAAARRGSMNRRNWSEHKR